MSGIGNKLREARLQWQLTLREVEERSSRIAQRWENPAYRISASWLDRVEREDRGLSATKLIVLAVIYGLTAEQMISLCPAPNGNALQALEEISVPNVTRLLEPGPLDQQARQWLPDSLQTDPPPETTSLLTTSNNSLPGHYRRGIIGKRDRTLDPMIRAGSIVLIDTLKRAIAGRREWTHEFDRPVYFLITHTGYAAGFCELDKEAEWLTLVPHPLSYESSRRWRFRKEVEVVGTVAAVFSRRID
ncbi:MAG TPA: helix-turn-helix transcriptional regulator [Acidobacteriaceae bacterium]|nr:helix-turn-helix transcriptional regulator [Acidobacteriaceae bacterium]